MNALSRIAAHAAIILYTAAAQAQAQPTPAQVLERTQETLKRAQENQKAYQDIQKQAAVGVDPCSLVSKAELQKVTGIKMTFEPESYNNLICSFDGGGVNLFKSASGWEQTLKVNKVENTPRTPMPAFGKGAYFMVIEQKSLGYPAVTLVAPANGYTVVLSLDGTKGRSPESLRPMLETLMVSAIARLPK